MIAIFFFVSQNEKEKDNKAMRQREREREKGKEKEMEEIRLILQTMSLYVSAYVTCLKQSHQSQMRFRKD